MITKEDLAKELEELEDLLIQQDCDYDWLKRNVEDRIYNLLVSCHAEGYRKGTEDMRELPF